MTGLLHKRLTILLFIFWLLFSLGRTSYAQSYGLQFSSHEALAENRTSLDLTKEGSICYEKNLEFSFDLGFLPNYDIYFGYVFRLINEKGQNIDLIYNQKEQAFQVIFGESFTGINFKIDNNILMGGWVPIKLQIDPDKRIVLSYLNQTHRSKPVNFTSNCFKLIFGVINEHDFISRDTPPMKIRNISIRPDGKEQYFWELNESSGTETADNLKRKKAKIINPNWLRPKHNNWEVVQSLRIKGSPSVAFNQEEETVYIVSADSLFTFSAKNLKLVSTPLSTPRKNLLDGNRSIYDPQQKKLFNYYIDQKTVFDYDFAQHRWNGDFILTPVTEYWHANSFIHNNNLYTVGGYGQLKYKNTFFKCDLNTNTWELLKPTGDFFAPRYLASLGTTTKGDTAYIFGGYGSREGDQVLSPKHFYGFFVYDVSKNHLTKIYSLLKPDEDFVLGNSMVITDGNYYALAFPNERFNNKIQLIKGSLQQPKFEVMGQPLPYSFVDIKSFADLYYCRKSQLLLAVTLFTNDEGFTNVIIYSIHFPPDSLTNAKAAMVTTKDKPNYLLYAAIIGIIVLSIGAWLVYKKNKTKKEVAPSTIKEKETEASPAKEIITPQPLTVSDTKLNTELSPVSAPVVPEPTIPTPKVEEVAISRINLFGSFEVTTQDGMVMTKQFTPLLKEMFLLILIDSLRYNKGVSSEKLNDTLWYDKDLKDAKNNRSVNLVKLKNILDKLGGCVINRETGNWKFEYDSQKVSIDFADYLVAFKEGTKDRPSADTANRLLSIVQEGAFLPQLHYEWLDPIKAEVSTFIIEYLVKYSETLQPSKDSEKLISIANAITLFDELNEYALQLKCKSLVLQGRHTLAKSTYDKFESKYKEIYGEEFHQSYHSIIE